MNADLQQLIELQQTDNEIKNLEAEINNIPERRAAIEQEFEQRAFAFREQENKRDAAQSLRAAREAEVAALREHLARAERNLMKSQTGDEYTAAIREADAARKQISTLETNILEGMDEIEKAESELATHAPQVERLRAETDARLQAFEAETNTQAARLAEARRRKEELISTVGKQTLSTYTRIASRIGNGRALAEARASACTACGMRLRPQMMVEVKRGDEIIMCENCSRILYYVPIEQQATAG